MNSTADNSVITVKNLTKSFGNQNVLKDVSLQLHKGENLVVLGKSGSGKSVLIKCMVRLLVPDGGTITVLNEDLGSLNPSALETVRKKIGFLFQSGALYDSMTVRQNLEFPLRRAQKKRSSREITDKIHETLELVGLGETIDKMPSQLSGGMRKRISLARTVIVDPEILLYDEPTTGLDPVTSAEISNLINDIQKRYKAASIIITHDILCARITAQRMIMLNEGSVMCEGTPEAFETSTDPLIKSFFATKG